MISKFIRRTTLNIKSYKSLNFNSPLFYKPQYNFFFTSSQDCYSRLNISKNASKDEINQAYHAQLRIIQSQSRNSRQEKEIQQLRSAFEEAMRNLNKKQSQEEEDTYKANNSYQQSSHSSSYQEQGQQQFQQNTEQKKRGWFKEFLLAQSFGQKPNAEQKQWGMELFALSILGITGICYVIGSNLKDYSKYNQDKQGARVIVSHKDLEIAKQQYKQMEEYKKVQQQIYEQQKQMQQQAQNSQVESEQDNIQGLFGKSSNSSSSSGSSFEKEFEEYKNKSSPGFFGGKDE